MFVDGKCGRFSCEEVIFYFINYGIYYCGVIGYVFDLVKGVCFVDIYNVFIYVVELEWWGQLLFMCRLVLMLGEKINNELIGVWFCCIVGQGCVFFVLGMFEFFDYYGLDDQFVIMYIVMGCNYFVLRVFFGGVVVGCFLGRLFG